MNKSVPFSGRTRPTMPIPSRPGSPDPDQAAKLAVFGRIHVDQVACRWRVVVRHLRLQAGEHGQPRRVLEQRRVLRDGDDVGVLGDGPEGAYARALVAVDRRLASQARPGVVRIPLFVGFVEDEVVDLVCHAASLVRLPDHSRARRNLNRAGARRRVP